MIIIITPNSQVESLNLISGLSWNKFLGPRWSHSYPRCHVSKPKLKPSCSCKCSAWPETQYSQSAIPRGQPSYGLCTYFLAPYSFSFFSLFLILHPVKASCLLPYSAVLWILGNGDCPLREVLNKIILCHQQSLIICITLGMRKWSEVDC